MNRKGKKHKGKLIFLWEEELPSRKWKWQVKVIQEILRRNRNQEKKEKGYKTGKTDKERRAIEENYKQEREGKWRQRGKNTMQINNEEEKIEEGC